MATTFPTASTAGRKRSRKSLAYDVSTTEMKRQHAHEAAGEMSTDHPEEEKWAVRLLLLLKATDSARTLSDDDDNDDQSESEGGDDNDDGSESESDEESEVEAEVEVKVEADEEEYDNNEVASKTRVTPTPLPAVRRSARTKRSSGVMSTGDYVWGETAEDEAAPMAVEGEGEAGDEEDSDVDDRASVAHLQRQTGAKADFSDDNQERDDHQAAMEEDDNGSSSNEDEQPEEEDFSEGDEYVDTSSSSRRTRNHNNNVPGAIHTPTKAGASDSQLTILPLSASARAGGSTPQQTTASRSASPSSPASGGGKKTRKPKYSAALEARWEEKFEWLMSYRRAKGNCRVAEGNKEYPGLGKWLSNQKTLCKKGKLKAERRQKLIDVGAIADPALKAAAAARLGASQSPPSSPSSLASPLPCVAVGLGHGAAGDDGDDDAQGPLTKRRRKGHSLVVNIDRIPSMSSDQEVDSAASSPSAASGLFSASSPFRTYQGKPILPSLSFPHPMAPGGLHTHLPPPPPQQQPGQQGHHHGGSTSFLSFALGAMPPVLFSPFSILGAPPGPTANHLAPSHL